MAIPPKSPASSTWSFGTSTEEVFAQQKQKLEAACQLKKEQIEQLQKVSELVSCVSEKLNTATHDTQLLLTQEMIQRRVPNQLTPTQCQEPIKNMEELLKIAQLAQRGEVLQTLEGEIQLLNQKTGRMEALAIDLNEQVSGINSLISQIEHYISAQEKTLAVARKLSENIDKFTKDV